MPFSFRYFECSSFPELGLKQCVSSKAQLAMPWGDVEAHSSMTYLGFAANREFERYIVEHQIEREIDAIYNQQRMHELIEVMQFTAYYNRNKNYFLVAAGKQESKSLFDRLARSSPPINTVPGRVDLNKLSEMGPTTGGWFGNLKVQEVSSAALFGTEMVVESPEWARYSKVGKISALNMRIADSLGSTRAVMVTQDRLVLLMKDHGENQNLMFVAYVNDLIEELGAGTVPASANKPSGE